MGRINGYIALLKEIIPFYIHRDEIILNEPRRKTVKNIVNLHYYSMCSSNPKRENLGDYLACVVYDYMTKLYGIDVNKKLKTTKHLYTVGSVIQIGFQNATVWGSGILYDKHSAGFDLFQSSKFRKLDIRAVRGPETRKMLLKLGHKCPEIYGDPAIILPDIYMPEKTEKTRKHLIVYHILDNTERTADDTLDIITKDYRHFIDELVKTETVITSSLHALILAETYGVSAVLYKAEKNPLDLHKFKDWYYSTGRYDFPIAHSIEEAKKIKPSELPDLTEMRVKLKEVFPVDLWDE